MVAKAEAETQLRKEKAEKLREAVKDALRYNVPWTVNVLENFTQYMRRITKNQIPKIKLGLDDVVYEDALIKGN